MPEKSKANLQSSLIEINASNREQLKRLVEVCFPITYKDEFYLRVVNLYSEFSRFIVIKDVIIGGVACRREVDKDTNEPFLHLMILLVLHKYRRFGLASKMLEFVYETLSKSNEKVAYLSLHVQKINEAAVNFYKKAGFEVIEEIPDYYNELEHPAALHMRKTLSK